MYQELTDKRVVITGAGAGIGRGIALRFGEEKSIVIVNDIRVDEAQKVVEEINSAGGKAMAIPGDMTKESDVNNLFDNVIENYQGVDILVNNVGLFKYENLVGSSLESWNRSMDLNVKSAFLCSNRAALEMKRNKTSHIINISSGAALIATTGAAAYGVAKIAIIGLTRTLAAELAPDIRVNTVLPGIIATDMDDAFVAEISADQGKSSEEFKSERANMFPLKRIGTPADVAAAVAFLTSDQAAYITGASINLTGGLVVD